MFSAAPQNIFLDGGKNFKGDWVGDGVAISSAARRDGRAGKRAATDGAVPDKPRRLRVRLKTRRQCYGGVML